MQQQLFEVATTKYYGLYRGQVIDNNDPDQAGKCQIRVGPMFLGVKDADLPWAFPAMPLVSGSGSGTGGMYIPTVNTWVYCIFIEGDVYQPVYCFEAPTKTLGIPPNALVGYPNTRGFTTPAGLQIDVNDENPTININSTPSGGINLTAANTEASGNLTAGTGATGSFVSADGKTIIVVQGVITFII